MSFGVGIGDVLLVIQKVRNTAAACRNGPSEFKDICREAESLELTFEALKGDAEDRKSLLRRRGSARASDLDQILENCRETMKELQTIVDKHTILRKDDQNKLLRVWHAHQVGSANLDSLRGKLTFHNSVIAVFLQSLQGSTMTRMEAKLDKIYRILAQGDLEPPASSSASFVSTRTIQTLYEDDRHDEVWEALRNELVDEGLMPSQLTAYRDRILDYFRSLIESEASPGTRTTGTMDGPVESASPSRSDPAIVPSEPLPDSQGQNALRLPPSFSTVFRNAIVRILVVAEIKYPSQTFFWESKFHSMAIHVKLLVSKSPLLCPGGSVLV